MRAAFSIAPVAIATTAMIGRSQRINRFCIDLPFLWRDKRGDERELCHSPYALLPCFQHKDQFQQAYVQPSMTYPRLFSNEDTSQCFCTFILVHNAWYKKIDEPSFL